MSLVLILIYLHFSARVDSMMIMIPLPPWLHKSNVDTVFAPSAKKVWKDLLLQGMSRLGQMMRGTWLQRYFLSCLVLNSLLREGEERDWSIVDILIVTC